MRVGTTNDFRDWLTAVGVSLPQGRTPAPAGWPLISIELPEYYGRNVAMLDAVFAPLCDPPFTGAVICTGEIAMISGESATGMIFDRLRSCAVGQPSRAEDLPFTEFQPNEYDDFYGLSLIAALGRWDFWIPASDRPYILRFSHDGFCVVGTKTPGVVEQVTGWLNQRKLVASRTDRF